MSTTERLKLWFDLADLTDTHGLPADLIWVKLDEINHPIAKQCTSEEFESHINLVVQLRQGAHKIAQFEPGTFEHELLTLTKEMMQN